MDMTTSKKRKNKQIFFTLLVLFVLASGYAAFKLYSIYWASNVENEEEFVYIPTGSSFEEVVSILGENKLIKKTETFQWVAKKMKYDLNVKPGKYLLTKGMNNIEVVSKLRSGNQTPVKFLFNNLRLKQDFAAHAATVLEADSASIMTLFDNDSLAEAYGFERETFFTMFIPNTYEFWWNTSAQKLFERMHTEYNAFWNENRKAKAKALNLNPIEVSILASIVKGEAMHTDEMPKIAGLYLNRLEKGILLQADPTVIFAEQNFEIRRVLNRHLKNPSPYNTYVHKGLPPGPIMLPSIASIDAVLNPEKHGFIYMCAKDDFSGYHNFATNIRDHMVNARKFQRALDLRNIKQ